MLRSFILMISLFFCCVSDAQTEKPVLRDTLMTPIYNNVAESKSDMKKVTSPVIFGDVNGDNVVDAIDVVDIVRYVKGKSRSAFKVALADINQDGVVNMEDAHALSSYLVGDEIPASSTPSGGTMQGSSANNPSF